MWIDILFPGAVTSRVYYEIVPAILVPENANLSGHDNGVIVFGTSMILNEQTTGLIINSIDDLHEASRNYLTMAVQDNNRREEYIPDILLLIRLGRRHAEGRFWDPIPIIANDADLIRHLFEVNRNALATAVGQIATNLGIRVDLYDFDFRTQDDEG